MTAKPDRTFKFTDLELPMQQAIKAMYPDPKLTEEDYWNSDLGKAFRAVKFVYGTQGANVISRVIAIWVQATAQVPESLRLQNVFDPGWRAAAYVHDDVGQMMDLYYGQYKNATYTNRNPVIGDYVHRAMGFAGKYDQDVPGYEAYWDTYMRVPSPYAGANWHPSPYYEGWEPPPLGLLPDAIKQQALYGKPAQKFFYPDPDKPKIQNPDGTETPEGMSGTKWMSRVIRQGMMYFGGTLVYDGAEVYYESVFSKRDVRDSDTAMEARSLFPHFVAKDCAGKAEVPFGNGTLIFNWFGKKAVPTQALFAENWRFIGYQGSKAFEYQKMHTKDNSLAALLEQKPPVVEVFSDLWALFPDGKNLNKGISSAERVAARTSAFKAPRNDGRESESAKTKRLAAREMVRSYVRRRKAQHAILEALRQQPVPPKWAALTQAAILNGLPKPQAAGKPGAYRDTSTDLLNSYGIPDSMAQALLDAATETRSVVSCRIPGEATTQLIDARYDLKGYFIKSLACDWGPMAGFVCQNPALNRYGSLPVGIQRTPAYTYNQQGLEDYLWDLLANFQVLGPLPDGITLKADLLSLDAKKKPKRILTLTALMELAFTPLCISQQRVEWLQHTGYLAVSDAASAIGSDILVDLVFSGEGNKSVAAEVVLIKMNNGLWRLFHGRVYHKVLKDGVLAASYTEYEYPPCLQPVAYITTKADPYQPVLTSNLASIEKTLADKLSAAQITPPANTRVFIPLNGATNPYQPYLRPEPPKQSTASSSQPSPPVEDDRFYLNCVVGEFDLVAVWPQLLPGGSFDLRRVSEVQDGAEKAKLKIVPLVASSTTSPNPNTPASVFTAVPGKPYTLELRFAPGVYFEFPPGAYKDPTTKQPENANLDSLYGGNVSGSVLNTAFTLNSLVTLRYNGSGAQANDAFRSDEGGRSGILTSEYPFLVFLPANISPDSGRVVVIRDHATLLELIQVLRGHCHITLNYGWMIHWSLLLCLESTFAVAKDDPAMQAKETQAMMTAFMAGIEQERAKLTPELTARLQYLLYTLLFPAPTTAQPAQKLTTDQLDVLASVFRQFVHLVADRIPGFERASSLSQVAYIRDQCVVDFSPLP